LEELSGKIGRGEEISELDLVFLPLCKSETSTAAELLERGIGLAAQLPSKTDKVAGLMITLSDKLVEKEELKRIWGKFMDMRKLKVFQVAEEVAREQGMELGMEKGIELGREMEREKSFELGIEKTAISLLKEGMNIPFISRVTGLSQEALQKLASKAS
jgi:hypothetical protein